MDKRKKKGSKMNHDRNKKKKGMISKSRKGTEEKKRRKPSIKHIKLYFRIKYLKTIIYFQQKKHRL